MINTKKVSPLFHAGLRKLGLDDDVLFLIKEQKDVSHPQIQFHLETAREFGATAIFFRQQLGGNFKPQIYLFDFTEKNFLEENEIEITEIQKKIWSSGEAPLACFFYNTEIKIVNCTKHITKDYKPEYLIKHLKLVGKAHRIYNEQFAVKIKSGIFWDQKELKKNFTFQNSAYDTLIKNIRFVVGHLKKKFDSTSNEVINKVIIQSILIKYLEERIDERGNKLLSEKYFSKYNASTFNDVLRQRSKFLELLEDLNRDFNGNVFRWRSVEQNQIKNLDLSIVADLLETDVSDLSSFQLQMGFPDWRYFEFKLIPVELISRLYEEFLGEEKQKKGLYYTPSHLAKLLVDESIPLTNYSNVDLENFTVLDPACGSGIFLVVSFKRLVQIWRLQNGMKFPDIDDLKPLLKNIYGVDKEEQAVKLASFSLSLALCNELNPVKIINELKFDDLTEENLINSDFFECASIQEKKFDLIIGNPPFVRGAISDYSNLWRLKDENVIIPQGQIALKFLAESFHYLKPRGLSCLIIKSSGLLYNSSSNKFKKALFKTYNTVQIFDFTALAEGRSLWDNKARVGSAAIFIRNENPDPSKNILHLTFRRTKATKERIAFEVDDYDLHYVDKQTALNNEYIWKINLLGGGRIKNIFEKTQLFPVLKEYLEAEECLIQEGHGTLKKKANIPTTINRRLLSSNGISSNRIFRTEYIPESEKEKINDNLAYHAPNIIISETIDINNGKLNIALNETENLVFKNRYVGIGSKNQDLDILKNIFLNLKSFEKFYILQFILKSAQLLINRNTAILAYDLYNSRFITEDVFSESDLKITDEVFTFYQEYLRIGEKSKAVLPIKNNKIYSFISEYGLEFSNALNKIYEEDHKRFRLSDIVQLENSLIAAIFKYDSKREDPKKHKDFSQLQINNLTEQEVTNQLSVKRIIKLYPQKDTIIFIKPNQVRYWLILSAYRDADKCFSDLSNVGDQ